MSEFEIYLENCPVLVDSYKYILQICSPTLLLVGTVGNILSLIVLLKRNMRRQSTYNYLAVLSIADTMVLYFGLLQYYLDKVYGYKVQSSWGCKIHTYIKFVMTDYSVWLIIAVTVERYIATAHTLRTAIMCTRKRALTVMLGIFGILLIINSHFVFTIKATTVEIGGENHTLCQGWGDYESFIENIWPICDAVIYSFLPFFIIIVLNILIIITVRKTKKELALSRRARTGKVQDDCERDVKLTIMLMTISFVFLITTVPVNIIMIVITYIRNNHNPADYDFCQIFGLKLARAVVMMLMYTNHSINFFLYLLTGNKFRQELYKLFKKSLRGRAASRSTSYSVVDNQEMTSLPNHEGNSIHKK